MTTGGNPGVRHARILGIEGLRGVAALLVIVTHTKQRLAPDVGPGAVSSVVDLGGQGLTLFFALSGFLLYLPFVAAILSGRRLPSTRRYFTNRFLRIFPAYWVILIAAILTGLVYVRTSQFGEVGVKDAQPTGVMTNPVDLLANLTMTQTLFPNTIKTGIPPAWSLTVEICFYLALPVLAWVAFKLVSRMGRIGAALLPPLILAGVGLVGKAAHAVMLAGASGTEAYNLEWGGNWAAVFSRSILVHADLFAFGMLTALVLIAAKEGIITSKLLLTLRTAAPIVGAVSVIAVWGSGYTSTAFALLFAGVILWVATFTRAGKPTRVARVLELRPFATTGMISYSLYLWHLPVIIAVSVFPFPQTYAGWALATCTVVAVTVLLSLLTYNLVEKQALKLKRSTRTVREPQPQAQ